jgi:hypothetical protein
MKKLLVLTALGIKSAFALVPLRRRSPRLTQHRLVPLERHLASTHTEGNFWWPKAQDHFRHRVSDVPVQGSSCRVRKNSFGAVTKLPARQSMPSFLSQSAICVACALMPPTHRATL